MDVIIREYKDTDASQVFEFWNIMELNPPERKDSTNVIEKTLSQFNGKLFIAETSAQREIVGTAWLTCDGRRLHMHHFGVRKSAQLKGIGSKLLISCVDYAIKAGYQLRLDVHKLNIKAKKLYQSFGFRAYEDYDIFVLREI